MSHFILTSASYFTCIHGGKFQHFPSYTPGFLIEGKEMCLDGDRFHIACPVGCRNIKWNYDTTGIRYFGKAILTTSSVGYISDYKGVMTGHPVWVSFQTTVTLQSFIDALKNQK